jgi:putative transposase
MAAPHRGNTGYSTYFITASTYQRRLIFQSDPLARLFVEVMLHYRQEKKYLLHEFVVMPDHFHLMLTPTLTLERALQLIKGGFSFRANKELGFGGEIWEKSFYDRRIRDLAEYGAISIRTRSRQAWRRQPTTIPTVRLQGWSWMQYLSG